MNALNIIFNAVSQLTGGLISDVTSMIVGMVVLAFIAMGIDHIKDTLDGVMARRASSKYLSAAEDAKFARDTNPYGSAEYDRSNALYRRFIRKSAESAERGWR